MILAIFAARLDQSSLHLDTGIAGTAQKFGMDQAVICNLRDGIIAEEWEMFDVRVIDPSI